MLEFLQQLKKWMIRTLEVVLIVIVALLVLDVVWGVFTRYVMSEQAKWSEELARFLLVWVALLGSALAFGVKAHLGVDYFVGRLHPESRKLTAIVSHIAVLFFAATVFVYGGMRVVGDALTMEQMTPALGWKMGYVYLALPISGVFMLLFTIEHLIETTKASPETEEGA
ncbi:TRAP transporter small permease [Puniceicoccaceae bacterium]|nr:TRAP transporter small permease [Puniceicoccaceae bacterium]